MGGRPDHGTASAIPIRPCFVLEGPFGLSVVNIAQQMTAKDVSAVEGAINCRHPSCVTYTGPYPVVAPEADRKELLVFAQGGPADVPS